MSDLSAFLAAVEAVEREAEKVVAGRIREAEEQRSKVSRFVEQARATLDDEESGEALGAGRPASKPGKKRPAAATPAAVRERRDGIERFVNEAQEPVAAQQVRLGLDLTDHCTKSGLKRLYEEGRIGRIGRGRATRYRAKKGRGATTETLQGRIIAVLHDRRLATLDELAQATRAPRDEVEKTCWALVREEEIRMDKRDGRTIYVLRRSA